MATVYLCFGKHDYFKLKWLEKWVITFPLLSRYWQEAQTLCRVVSQRLADAQSQSESVEIKYSKAKRLVREYQSRYLNIADNVAIASSL